MVVAGRAPAAAAVVAAQLSTRRDDMRMSQRWTAMDSGGSQQPGRQPASQSSEQANARRETHEETELAAAGEAAVDVLVRRLQFPPAVRVGAHLPPRASAQVRTARALGWAASRHSTRRVGGTAQEGLTAWIHAIHDTACSSDAGSGWTSIPGAAPRQMLRQLHRRSTLILPVRVGLRIHGPVVFMFGAGSAALLIVLVL